MPPPEVDITPDTIQRHTGALRALALRLIGDEHAADDVVQDTWLAALAHREGGARREGDTGPGPWLRTVVRRLAGRRIRTELRREDRERDAAHPESSDDDPARRTVVFAAVTSAILALDEPYRETLLLRYVEDRPPRDIARQQGLPLATVKSRLARGLDRVRADVKQRLDDEGIEYLGGLALLVGAPHFAPPLSDPHHTGAPGAPETGVVMPKLSFLPLAVSGGAIALSVAAVAWFTSLPNGEEDAPAASVRTLEAARTAQAAAPAAETPEAAPARTGAGTRRAIATDEPTAAGGSASSTFAAPAYELLASLTDQDGLPLRAAELFAAPPSMPLNRVGETDASGRLAFRFHGAEGRQPLVVAARTPSGAASRLFSLDLAAGVPYRLDLALLDESRFEVALRTTETDASGAVIREVDFSASFFPSALDDAPRFAANLFFARSPELLIVTEEGPLHENTFSVETGNVTFGTSGGTVTRSILTTKTGDVTLPAGKGTADQPFVLRSTGSNEMIFEAPEGAVEPARVHGRLVRPDGAPAAGVRVLAIDATGERSTRTRTDEDGRFHLDGLAPGEVTLFASTAGVGTARHAASLTTGAELRWDAVLEPGRTLSGRLVDPDGDPLADAAVEFLVGDDAHTWRAVQRTDADGGFRFTGVPDARGQLLARLGGARTESLPDWVREDVWPGELGTFEVPAPRRGGLELAVHGAGTEPVPPVELRLWQDATGSARSAESEDEGAFALDGLPGGAYTARLGWANGSWTDLGPLWIEPGEPLDLGTVQVPATGTLALAAEPGRLPEGLGLWRAVGGGAFALVERFDLTAVAQGLEVDLGPGEYALGIELEELFAGARFTLAPGGRVGARIGGAQGSSGIVVDGASTTAVTLPPLPIVTFGVMIHLPEDGD